MSLSRLGEKALEKVGDCSLRLEESPFQEPIQESDPNSHDHSCLLTPTKFPSFLLQQQGQ